MVMVKASLSGQTLAVCAVAKVAVTLGRLMLVTKVRIKELVKLCGLLWYWSDTGR